MSVKDIEQKVIATLVVKGYSRESIRRAIQSLKDEWRSEYDSVSRVKAQAKALAR